MSVSSGGINPNAPSPVSLGMAKDYPLLWEIAQQYDLAKRLGGCQEPLWGEVDKALRELWDARNYVRDEASRV